MGSENLKPELTQGEYPQTIYGLSSKGWMDMELFEKWFSRLFLCCAPGARPLLLLLDGHSSHYSPAAIRMAAEEQVILFVLPPNTTHLSQPLDKGVFGPLKMQWRKACHSYMTRNPGKVVNRYAFSQLFHTAWLSAMTTKNIAAGFRTTGIYPVDRNAIVLPGEKKKKSLSEETGVPYIPLFTPSKQHRIRTCEEHSDDEEGSSPSPAIHDCLSLQSDLTKMLNVPHLPPPLNPLDEIEKYGARVLTSRENLELIEKKERAKEEEKKAKQDAKKRRENAKKEREKEKEKAKEERARVREQRKKSKQDAKEQREIAKQRQKETKAKEKAKQNKNAKKTQRKSSKGVYKIA